MRNLACAAFGLLMLATSAMAHAAPPEIQSVLHADKPYGHGTLSRWFISIYDTALWMDAPVWSYKVPFALINTYHMGFDSDDLVDRTLEEMQHQQPLSADDEKKYHTALVAVLPPVQNGDRITALYVPKRGITFYHNDQQTGQIPSDDFAQRFMNIWLANTTSEPELRAQLLAARP